MDANDLFVLSRQLVLLLCRSWYASQILLGSDHLYHDIDLLAVQVVQMVFLFAAAGESFYVDAPRLLYITSSLRLSDYYFWSAVSNTILV
jgi:hypothetical protein